MEPETANPLEQKKETTSTYVGEEATGSIALGYCCS
jgi:hypothetical protein